MTLAAPTVPRRILPRPDTVLPPGPVVIIGNGADAATAAGPHAAANVGVHFLSIHL